MIAACQRCGKTLRIEKDGDGIHTCTPKAHQTREEAVSFEVSGEVTVGHGKQGGHVE